MHNTHTISLKTKLALAFTLFFWASAFVGIRIGLQGYTPGSLALFRFLVASVCMFFIYLGLKTKSNIKFIDKCLILFIGAVAVGGYHVALNYGELTVSSGIASFIISQSPIITTAFALIFLGESLPPLGYLGILVSVVGVTFIMLGQDHSFNFELGNLYIFAAAVAGSIVTIWQKPFLKKYHAIEVTAYLIWGSVLSLIFYLPSMIQEIHTAPAVATYAAIYLGIFPAALAYLAWSYVLADMPASRASNFMYFMPLIATLLGWIGLNEVPGVLAMVGGIVALLGVWVVNLSYQRRIALATKLLEKKD